MVPTGEDAKRKSWLKNRQYRLQQALENGEVELALNWISDIRASAKPGDISYEKLESLRQSIGQAKTLITKAQNDVKNLVI